MVVVDHDPIPEAGGPPENKHYGRRSLIERLNRWTIRYNELLALALGLATLIVAVLALLD